MPPEAIIRIFIKHWQALRSYLRSGMGMGGGDGNHPGVDAILFAQSVFDCVDDITRDHQDFHIAEHDRIPLNLQEDCGAFQFIEDAIRLLLAHTVAAHIARLLRCYIACGCCCLYHSHLNNVSSIRWLNIPSPSVVRSKTLRPST